MHVVCEMASILSRPQYVNIMAYLFRKDVIAIMNGDPTHSPSRYEEPAVMKKKATINS